MTDIETGTRARHATTARVQLADRVLVLVSSDAAAFARLVPASTSGLVVAGEKALSTVHILRHAHPDLLLLAEPPESSQVVATPTEPFVLPSGGLFHVSLDEVLDQQVLHGASIAVTPTGFIQGGDSDSAKAAVAQANTLDREDVLLLMPCDWTWCREPALKQLIAILSRSRHPVAVALGHGRDPLAEKGVVAGLRSLSAVVPWVMPWRTDLAAFDAIAHGAKAAAVGVLPSQRHAGRPGRNGFAINKNDRTPKVLVPELLRYVRASYMQDTWFASATPWTCACSICLGRPIDRFDGSDGDRLLAHQHNVVALMSLHEEMQHWGSQGSDWWRQQLQTAQIGHARLEAHTAVKTPLPEVLENWVSL